MADEKEYNKEQLKKRIKIWFFEFTGLKCDDVSDFSKADKLHPNQYWVNVYFTSRIALEFTMHDDYKTDIINSEKHLKRQLRDILKISNLLKEH
jgi:hypothetical protein